MEREFGISCPLSLPKDQNPEDMLDVDKQESGLQNILQSHQEELQRAQNTISSVEEEKNKVGRITTFFFTTILFGDLSHSDARMLNSS